MKGCEALEQIKKFSKWARKIGIFLLLAGIVTILTGTLIMKAPIGFIGILLMYAGSKSMQAHAKSKHFILERNLDQIDLLFKEISLCFSTLYWIVFLSLLYALSAVLVSRHIFTPPLPYIW